VLGFLTAEGRSVAWGTDQASLYLLQRADEIIITNRTLLYAQHDPQQVTTFLQNLYAFAQGPPFNWSPASVIYYVDAYNASLQQWDNTAVNYASEATANVTAEQVDDLVEDWVEDSTTQYYVECTFGGDCYPIPVDPPLYLLIAGDDHIIPFFRKDDPTDGEGEHPCPNYCSPINVLNTLRGNNAFFTDNLYGDLSYVHDDFPWDEGGVELAVGRLIGTLASHLSTLLHNGQYGPDRTHPARAIVASACDSDAEDLANHLIGYGYDVRNDTESPCTLDNDNWTRAALLSLMGGDYQILHHGNHATEEGWTTPPCGPSLPKVTPKDLISSTIAARIGTNYPIFTSNGCRAGLAAARSGFYMAEEPTMVNGLVRDGVSAVVASTGLTQGCSWPDGCTMGGEEFIKDFWGLAASPPPRQLNLGMALRWAKRTWDGHFSVDAEEEKTGAEFVLYGIPWITAPYRGGTSSRSPQPLAGQALSPPQPLGGGVYVVTATFDASNYSVNTVDGFDLVEVEGMELGRDTGVPLVPLAEVELQLPRDGSVMEVEAIATDPADLGVLNIHQSVPGIPIPGGDPGGPAEAPDIGVYPPEGATFRTVSLDGYNLARVYASPLSYNTTTDQATLYRSLALRITYHLSSTVGLLEMSATPNDLAPGQSFSLAATLVNPASDPATLTGTLVLKDDLGQVVSTMEIDPFTVVPGGEPYPLEIAWVAPSAEGAYSLFLELYHEGRRQAVSSQALRVAGGRITGLTVPEHARPGQEVTFGVTFANRRVEAFEGQVTLAIYRADGVFVTALAGPISVGPQGETTVELLWETTGMPSGGYAAAARVVDTTETLTYGVVQENFNLEHAVFLPLAMRGH